MPTHKILQRLKADLLAARKTHDRIRVQVLQSTLSRITNAEAVPIGEPEHATGSNIGAGSTEVMRRELSEQDIIRIIQDEIDELYNAVSSMGVHADNQYGSDLKQKAHILTSYIDIGTETVR